MDDPRAGLAGTRAPTRVGLLGTRPLGVKREFHTLDKAAPTKRNGRDCSRPLLAIGPLRGGDHFSNCSFVFGAAALTFGADGPFDCLPAGAPGGMSSISEIGAASPWRVLTLMMRV